MVAVKNGYDSVINSWATGGVVVDVWAKDPEGKTAWDYIKTPKNRHEAFFANRMNTALRILEIYQIIGNKGHIVQSVSGINSTQIWIEGASCRDFSLPKNVQCIESMKNDHSGSSKEVYEKDVKRGVPHIFAAIQNHQYEKLEELLRSGEDVEQKNKFGTGPLSFTIYQHDIKLVKILLEYGADPKIKEKFGYDTISVLSRHCRNKIDYTKMKSLLENGVE